MRAGVTFRYFNLRFTSVPAQNCKPSLDKCRLYYQVIGSISPLLQACPEHRQSRCLQIGVFMRTLAEDGRMSFRSVPSICRRRVKPRQLCGINTCAPDSSCHDAVFMRQSVMRQVAHICHFSKHSSAVIFFTPDS